ncbi:MAG: UbiA family prenyltransferase [Thermoanaerobaculia bacterium]
MRRYLQFSIIWAEQSTRLRAWLRLFRTSNSVVLALLYIAAARFFGSTGGRTLVLRAVSWLCVAAFSYSLNDLLDVEIDRRNRPDRPLPNGAISNRAAMAATALVGSVASALSLFSWGSPLNWAVAGLAGATAYSFFIRPRYATLANALAAGLVTLVPISAQLHALDASGLALYGTIFTVIFARELQKDILDAPGDAIARTVGLLVGPHRRGGRVLYAVLLLASLVLLAIVAATGERRVPFLITAVPMALLITALSLFATGIGGARVQVTLTKVVAYLFVPLLFVGSP